MDLNATAVELAEISLWLDTMVSRAAGTVVRPAPAARQLADRCPACRLLARPGERQVLAEGHADRCAAHRHGRRDGRRRDRPGDQRTHPPLPAARERLGLGGRGEGSRGARARSRCCAEEVALGRSPASPARSRSTRWSSWRTGSSRCGSSRCGGCRSPSRKPGATSRCGAGEHRSTPTAVTPGADRGHAQRPGRRLPAAAPSHGCLGRALVLAAHRHRRRDARPAWTSGSRHARSCSAANRRRARRTAAGPTFERGIGWDDLNDAEELNLDFAGAMAVEQVLKSHPWLRGVPETSPSSRASSTGNSTSRPSSPAAASTSAGNPPWVRPDTDVDALLAEGDPWWQLALKPSEASSRR